MDPSTDEGGGGGGGVEVVMRGEGKRKGRRRWADGKRKPSVTSRLVIPNKGITVVT
jgi:hypothetical protein